MRKMDQTATRGGQLFPYPADGGTVHETPPVFRWRRDARATELYRVTVWDGDGKTAWSGETRGLYIAPDAVLPCGRYEWDVESGDLARGRQTFFVAPDATLLPRVTAEQLLDAVPDAHPRHLFAAEDIPSLLIKHGEAVETLRLNISIALARELPDPPRYHRDKNALPYREYFGLFRTYCDRDMVACALGYALLGDERAGDKAKELFFTMADMSPFGPASPEGKWGDEVGLSLSRCLPAVYDMIYGLMDDRERAFAARTIACYAAQCEERLARVNFNDEPGSSHAGRLPAYIGEAALALKGSGEVDRDTLLRWLSLALGVYGGFFPYYGGEDGSWAEGMFYAASYTKWFLPFFSAVRRFTGCDFLKRPFYRNYVRYLQHFCPPGWENHPFCDGYWCLPEDEEWPGFFAQDPYRVYADRFGDELTRAWRVQADVCSKYELHLLDIFLPDGDMEQGAAWDRAHAFPDGGFLSLHTDPPHPADETVLLARASRFGSVSHEHADQGSFAILADGTALISPSGYFGREFGTKHHFEWTRQTKAHNCLLVNGEGQEAFSYRATGKVLGAADRGDVLTGAVDASDAYPALEKWVRTFEVTRDRVIVRDHVEAKDEVEISYLLHALSRPCGTERGARITRHGISLLIEPVKGLLPGCAIKDTFDTDVNEGVPAEYAVTVAPQYHMTFVTEKARVHDIEVVYRIIRTEGKA